MEKTLEIVLKHHYRIDTVRDFVDKRVFSPVFFEHIEIEHHSSDRCVEVMQDVFDELVVEPECLPDGLEAVEREEKRDGKQQKRSDNKFDPEYFAYLGKVFGDFLLGGRRF